MVYKTYKDNYHKMFGGLGKYFYCKTELRIFVHLFEQNDSQLAQNLPKICGQLSQKFHGKVCFNPPMVKPFRLTYLHKGGGGGGGS